jgi:hypothetical protein
VGEPEVEPDVDVEPVEPDDPELEVEPDEVFVCVLTVPET